MKKYQVQMTAKALRDVEGVLHWLCDQHALVKAGRWYSQLMARIDTLEQQPARCRLAAEADQLDFELRELLFGKQPQHLSDSVRRGRTDRKCSAYSSRCARRFVSV